MHHQTHKCTGHFMDCVNTGQQSFLSFVNSAPVAEIGWAAQMSAAWKKPIDLPLDHAAAAEFFGKNRLPRIPSTV